MAPGAEGEQLVARVLEVPLQEQAGGRGQEQVLAVGGAHVLQGPHGGGHVRHLEGRAHGGMEEDSHLKFMFKFVL